MDDTRDFLSTVQDPSESSTRFYRARSSVIDTDSRLWVESLGRGRLVLRWAQDTLVSLFRSGPGCFLLSREVFGDAGQGGLVSWSLGLGLGKGEERRREERRWAVA